MTQKHANPAANPTVRPLTAEDFEAVVSLDRDLSGIDRSGFFEKRLKSATDAPKDYVYVALCEGNDLKGFAMAGLIRGEFDDTKTHALLDAFGVDPTYQHHGAGHMLMAEVRMILGHKGVGKIQSQVAYRDRALLGFLGEIGFNLDPSIILTRTTEKLPVDTKYSDGEDTFEADEIDHSWAETSPEASLENDAINVRTMSPDDIAAISRIDKKLIGTAREKFFEGKLQQIRAQSGVQASLVAEIDGLLVGFIMAGADFGAFGRTLPEAVMDTFGVDPGFQGRGIGHALMSQLIGNLSILQVENLRTEVSWNNVGMIAFFDSVGFVPAQRIKVSARV